MEDISTYVDGQEKGIYWTLEYIKKYGYSNDISVKDIEKYIQEI